MSWKETLQSHSNDERSMASTYLGTGVFSRDLSLFWARPKESDMQLNSTRICSLKIR